MATNETRALLTVSLSDDRWQSWYSKGNIQNVLKNNGNPSRVETTFKNEVKSLY